MNFYTDHTKLDRQAFIDAGIDPDSTEPRHRDVPCLSCRKPTFNLMAGCDVHWQTPVTGRYKNREAQCGSGSTAGSDSDAGASPQPSESDAHPSWP